MWDYFKFAGSKDARQADKVTEVKSSPEEFLQHRVQLVADLCSYNFPHVLKELARVNVLCEMFEVAAKKKPAPDVASMAAIAKYCAEQKTAESATSESKFVKPQEYIPIALCSNTLTKHIQNLPTDMWSHHDLSLIKSLLTLGGVSKVEIPPLISAKISADAMSKDKDSAGADVELKDDRRPLYRAPTLNTYFKEIKAVLVVAVAKYQKKYWQSHKQEHMGLKWLEDNLRDPKHVESQHIRGIMIHALMDESLPQEFHKELVENIVLLLSEFSSHFEFLMTPSLFFATAHMTRADADYDHVLQLALLRDFFGQWVTSDLLQAYAPKQEPVLTPSLPPVATEIVRPKIVTLRDLPLAPAPTVPSASSDLKRAGQPAHENAEVRAKRVAFYKSNPHPTVVASVDRPSASVEEKKATVVTFHRKAKTPVLATSLSHSSSMPFVGGNSSSFFLSHPNLPMPQTVVGTAARDASESKKTLLPKDIFLRAPTVVTNAS